MSLIDDILKGLPENALLRQKLLDLAALQAATETENAILKDDLREAKMGIAQRDIKIAALQKVIDEFARVDEDPASTVLEIADYLGRTVRDFGSTLIRFDLVAKEIRRTSVDVSNSFAAAAEKAGVEVTDKTNTHASCRRSGPFFV